MKESSLVTKESAEQTSMVLETYEQERHMVEWNYWQRMEIYNL